MNCSVHLTAALATTLVLGAGAWSATIYVDAANCPGPGDGTLGDPYCSIQDAIAVAVSGVDAVEVAPGTYAEAIDFLGSAITVYSTGGPGVTLIDGGGIEPHVVTLINGEGPDAVLDGFTITGGNANLAAPDDRGGGMRIEGGSPTVIDCVLLSNHADVSGGGLYVSNADPLVIGCMFMGNTTGSRGGAVYLGGGALGAFVNCAFSGNSSAFQGGALFDTGSPTFANCSFTANASPGGGGVMRAQSGGAPILYNCILWDNGASPIQDTTGGLVIAYSDVEGGWAGTGNIDADPLFADADGADDTIGTADDDLRLLDLSPCTDAGDNAAVPADAADLDGDLDTGEPIPFDLDFNDRFSNDPAVADTGAGTPPIVDMGAYERQGGGGSTISVPGDFPTIQQGIDAALDGDEVVVAPGTYTEAIDFGGRAIAVRSSGGPAVTIIDGAGSFRVVRCANGEGPDTVLEGFTITGGFSTQGGGMYNNDSSPTVTNCIFSDNHGSSGGGMFNLSSSPTVTDCIFSDNSATSGGGMYNIVASPAVTNCVFSGNAATNGGGMYNTSGSSNPAVTNCTFIGNSASSEGGGMRNQAGSTPTVTNCAYSGNSAGSMGGGMFNSGSSPLVNNAVLWGNTPEQIAGDAPTISFSDVEGGFAGTGNIDADPLFADADLRLGTCSPALDAGDDGAVPGGVTTDLDGNPRFVDVPGAPDSGAGFVDMGAYEFQGDSFSVLVLSADGSGDFPTIQAAIDAMCPAGEIILEAGTYTGAGNRQIDLGGKDMMIRSATGDPADVVIDCEQFGRAFVFVTGETAAAGLDGITIRNGLNQFGNCCGGIAVSGGASPTITSCVFDNCEAQDASGGGGSSYGGAIGVLFDAGTPAISDCAFTLNLATYGGAIDNEASVIVDDSIFTGNAAALGAGVYHIGDALTVAGCDFDGNAAHFGGAIYGSGGLALLSNCIFEGNTATGDGGGIDLVDNDADLVNCLFAGNTSQGDPVMSGGVPPFGGGGVGIFDSDVILDSVSVTNCTFVGNAMTGTDPSDGGGGIAALGAVQVTVSNCITRGNTGPAGNTTEQAQIYASGGGGVTAGYSNIEGLGVFVGNGNIDGDAQFVDESGGDLRLDRYSPCIDAADNGAIGVATDLDGNPRNFDDDGVGDTGLGAPPIVDMGAYERQSVSAPIVFKIGPGDSIQDTIDDALDGDEIVLNAGTYTQTFNFGGKAITLRSADGPAATIIDGGGISAVVVCDNGEGPGTVLDGFTITGGNASSGGGMRNAASSPTVTNCIFSDNHATSLGGGMYNSGDATVTNCIFVGNSSGSFGGGMRNIAGDPTIANCMFSGNSAATGGGAMYNSSGGQTVTNCTFGGNSAGDDGGAIYVTSGGTIVTNCVLWGDTPNESGGVPPTVSFSDVLGGFAGPGNIDLDPQYADPDGADDTAGTPDDDLRFGAYSAAVDGGTGAPPGGLPATDLDGNPRTIDGDLDGVGVVDMGAYETDPDTIAVVANLTQGTAFGTFAAAAGSAADGDELLGTATAFVGDGDIDLLGLSLTVRSTGSIDQPAGGSYTLADDAVLRAAAGESMSLAGALAVPFGDRVDLVAQEVVVEATGVVTMSGASVTDVSAPAGLRSAGVMSLYGGSLGVSGGLTNEAAATLTAFGGIQAQTANDGDVVIIADAEHVGDYVNNGTTTVQNGTLTIIGTLTDNGTIVGDVAGGSAAPELPVAAGDGLAVIGGYAAGAGATLLMPSSDLTVKVAGDFDVAIDDSDRYDMAQAELRLVAVDDGQNLEIMSLDVGPDPDGLDRTLPGHFPIGTLRIGPTPATVDMVDNHDNDGLGQGVCEAIYVGNLVIDAGAMLNTNGCPVYYSMLTLDGDVDDPGNLHLIVDAAPCPWDCADGDGTVGITDFLALLAQWNQAGTPCDVDGGGVGITDFLALLAGWGACP